jgi:hypothetical protein
MTSSGYAGEHSLAGYPATLSRADRGGRFAPLIGS